MTKERRNSETGNCTTKLNSPGYGEPIDSMPYSVVEIDRQINIAFVNRATYRAFGYDQNDMGACFHALQLFAPEDRQKAQVEIEHRFDGGGTNCIEFTAQTKDGLKFPVALYFSPILRGGKTVRLRTFWLTLQSEQAGKDPNRGGRGNGRKSAGG
jgi:PAS domain S-box-containing protein